jgi:Pro-kumamolisin, activation domain
VPRFPKYSAIFVCLCVAITTAFAQGGLKDRIQQKIDSSQMTVLRGNVSPLLQSAVDQGKVDRAMRINGASIFFAPSASQKAAIQQLMAEQRDPASPNYRQWLTPEEYADRFGMSSGDISKVSAWLKSQGFTVDNVTRSRNRISFSGSVARMETAFHTEFHSYLVNGEKHFANATELSVPAAMAGTVMGFTSLNNFRWHPRNVQARSAVSLKPRLTLSNPTETFLLPDDVAVIYNIAPLYNTGIDGTGQAIAVVGQTAIDLNDIAAFRSIANLPAKAPQLVLVPGTGASAIISVGDQREANLDVEWSGGIARNATIIYVYTGNSPNSNGVIDSIFYAIDNDLAPVVSISYGACEASNPASFISLLQSEARAGSLQGQTMVSAVGDAGATDCDNPNSAVSSHGLAVDIPGALAEVTGVGGTTFMGDENANPTYWNAGNGLGGGSAKSFIPEKVWNDSALRADLSATGGGVSTVIPKPSYQTALTPADGFRDVPDIAFSASPEHDAYFVCTEGSCPSQFLPIGGTSADAPVFAGILTLVNQATENAAGQGTNVNPTLYSLAGVPGTYAAVFHDVTTGNNKETCLGGSTGCTTANSHALTAENHSGFRGYLALMLFPVCAVLVSLKRKRWVAALGVFLVAGGLAFQVACGGGSSSTPPPPPPNLSIGFSATTGYDRATGLGSVDASELASHWPGFTGSPKFGLSSAPTSITMTTATPGTSTVTVTRMDGAFTGTVNLSCRLIDPKPTDPQSSTCTLNPTLVNLGSSAATALTVHASVAGNYTVVVTGRSGAVSHSATVPVTVN